MSSKFLNIQNGNYKVKVQDGGNITLDTGDTGLVKITGNLQVLGDVTEIETENTLIEDNIIVLNKGETEPGISVGDNTSGIRIDRGTINDALWVFDENLAWTDTQNPGTSDLGAWSARDPQGRITAIEAVSIITPGVDLNLLGVYQGSGGAADPNPGKVTVLGTVDYENRVTDDDDIPNKKYVDDEISSFFGSTFQDKITEGTFSATETSIEVFDNTVTGSPSHAQIKINGISVADFSETETDIQNLKIQGSAIETATSNEDLILGVSGSGTIVMDNNVTITKTTGTDPSEPDNGMKLYSKTPGAGGSGLYFVDEDSKRDEIISKNRALVFGMLF
jgi:hypothetical protein